MEVDATKGTLDLKTQTKFCPVFYTSCPIRTNFGARDTHEKFGKCQGSFYENRLGKCHTSLMVENEFLTALPTFNVRL
jgi:hypothetical protein